MDTALRRYWSFRMMTSSNGNIFHVTGHLCGEFTSHRWIPCTKGQWRGALMFSLICAWMNGWVNNGEAVYLRRHRAHYDVIVMLPRSALTPIKWTNFSSILFYSPIKINRQIYAADPYLLLSTSKMSLWKSNCAPCLCTISITLFLMIVSVCNTITACNIGARPDALVGYDIISDKCVWPCSHIVI